MNDKSHGINNRGGKSHGINHRGFLKIYKSAKILLTNELSKCS